MNEKKSRAGTLTGVFAGWLVFYHALTIANGGYALSLLLEKMHSPPAPVMYTLAGIAWGSTLLLLISGGIMRTRARRMIPGTRGRTRIAVASWTAMLHAIFVIALSTNFHGASVIGMALSVIAPSEFLIQGASSVNGSVLVFSVVVLAVDALLLLVLMATTWSFWFLLTTKARKRVWQAVDVLTFAAFAYCLHAFRFNPRLDHPEDLNGSVIRLLVTVLFVIRVLSHLTPLILDVIESINFRTMVSARMLRAGKSGFLTTIGLLSILAVTVASAAPSIVLSVMGGFRQDLKRKILGNNAHVVIDRDHGNFEGWGPLIERTRAIPGVTGAAPYVAGEVMISSSSNLGGAVLRGIDPDLINQVTDLNRNITHGRMDYLVHPERLLHLAPSEVNGAPLPLTNALGQRNRASDSANTNPAPGDAGPANARGSIINDIDQVVRDAEPGQAPATPTVDDPRDDGLDQFLLPRADVSRPREVLPGVIIGQELARTLRLFLGDEVNIVSPFGGLGPSGPVPKSRTFRVAGIFYSGMYEYDMKYVYMMLPVAQDFLSTGDAISGIEVKVSDMEHAPEARARIEQALHRSDLRVRDWKELNRNLFGALALEKLAMFLALGIAIVVAGFCVFGTLTLMVQEKSRQVGVLKAMGTTPKAIVSIFLSEGLLIGVFGATMGLGVGYVVCFTFEHFGVRMNPEVYYIDRLPISIDPIEFLLVAVSSVAVCLLATIFPAILASRVSPIQALRQD